MARGRKLETYKDYMRHYPRITSHIISESLGYATPSRAASILQDAHLRRENYCEWIYSCYDKNALKAVQNAIRSRHTHKGFMAEYKLARAIVDRAVKTGVEPELASWF
jgi:hypothetical protein